MAHFNTNNAIYGIIDLKIRLSVTHTNRLFKNIRLILSDII